MRRAGALVVLSLAASAAAIAPGIKVTPAVATDGRLLVSFTAAGAFDDAAKTVVRSGLQLTYTYTVELRRPSLWVDPTLATITVAATVQHDPLTRTYQVSRLRDGQVERSEKLEQEAQLRAWLTEFQNVRLDPSSPLVLNEDYYVRVRLRATPKPSLSLWPWRGDDASGRADFAYIR
jgi:hypothetical protein